MKIAVLALDHVFDMGLVTVLDAFTTANELAQMTGLSEVRFDVEIVGVRRRVRTAQGLQREVAPLASASADWLVIPAIAYKMPEALTQALTRADVRDSLAPIRAFAQNEGQIAAACIGTFILGETGLLAGHTATTTWWLVSLFRERYPDVKLDAARMLVSSGSLLTAGAALSHIDLALALIRQRSPALADMTAQYLIVDKRPAQSAYVIHDHLQHRDPLVMRFEQWARANLAQGFSLAAAADALATSKRTLARRMEEKLGKTPLSYFQDLRVERAVHLLKTSGDSVENIAQQLGYADGVTLRNLLRRHLHRGVREIRAQR